METFKESSRLNVSGDSGPLLYTGLTEHHSALSHCDNLLARLPNVPYLKAGAADSAADKASATTHLDIPHLGEYKLASTRRSEHQIVSEQLPVALLRDKNVDTDAMINSVKEHGKIRLVIVDDWQHRKKIPGTGMELPFSSHGDHTELEEYQRLPGNIKERVELVRIDSGVIGMPAALAKANEYVSKNGVPAIVSIANDNELSLASINQNYLSPTNQANSFHELTNERRSQAATKLLSMHPSSYADELRQVVELSKKGSLVVGAAGNDQLQVTSLAESVIVTRGLSEPSSNADIPFTDARAAGKNSSESTRETVRALTVGLLHAAFPDQYDPVPHPQPAPQGIW